MSNRWIRTEEAAERIKHSPTSLVSWRWRGMGPPYSKMGRVVVYDVEALDHWVEAQRVEPVAKYSQREAAQV